MIFFENSLPLSDSTVSGQSKIPNSFSLGARATALALLLGSACRMQNLVRKSFTASINLLPSSAMANGFT